VAKKRATKKEPALAAEDVSNSLDRPVASAATSLNEVRPTVGDTPGVGLPLTWYSRTNLVVSWRGRTLVPPSE